MLDYPRIFQFHMFYLIGGAPRCGKTTLSKIISKKTGIPWVSADTLESIVYAYTPKNLRQSQFPKNYIREKTKWINDLTYAKYSPQAIAKAYIKQSKATWTAIQTFIECETEFGHSYIIEGHQIHPALIKKLIKKFPGHDFRTIFLYKGSPEKIVHDNTKNPGPKNWFIHKSRKPEVYQKIAKMISIYGNYFLKDARKHGFKILNTENDFPARLEKAADQLIDLAK